MTANEWSDLWRQRYSGKDFGQLTAEERQGRQDDGKRARLLALEKMVLGAMEATAIGYSARMPEPLPDLEQMAASEAAEHYFKLPGMYGGFKLTLHDLDSPEPYVLAECWSRVVGGSQLLRRISSRSVEIVSEGLY